MPSTMNEAAAQSVLLARAFEEADADGLLLSIDDRQAATEAARASGGAPEAQAERRAVHLLGRLEAEVPALGAVRRATRLPRAVVLPVAAVALVVGVASNALGPERHVNVLSFPLLGLLLWNLGVYAGLTALALGRLAARRGRDAVETADAALGDGAGWRGALGRTAHALAERSLRRVRLPDAPRTSLASRALRDYWRAWSRLEAPIVASRVRLALHVGAALLVVGAVLGMYVRGLTFEYRATWESTFVGPATAALLLRVVLGPAAALLGVALPDAAALAAMRAPGDAPAASWIHLWAVTATLVVLVPRGAAALLAWLRDRRLSRALAVDPLGGSFRVLLAPDRGAGTTVLVVPYSYGVTGRQADTLRELLHDVFGLRADVRIAPSHAYGDDPGPRDAAAHAVVVYGLVQSPEREVHGRFARELADAAANGARVLALVDSSAWHARFAADDGRRENERRRAWERVLNEVGVVPLHVNLAAPLDTRVVEQAEEMLGAARGGR